MNKSRKKTVCRMLAAALAVSAIAPPACEIRAAQQSLSSVTEEAQILPMGDGSGKYMMKSDGFYCLDVSGARSTTEEVHYFHNFEIDGTVFDGFYYHDKDGKFKAASSHMEHFKNVPVFGSEKKEAEEAEETEKEGRTTAESAEENPKEKAPESTTDTTANTTANAATDAKTDTAANAGGTKLDGFYFVNNLGKLSAAAQVRYIDNLTLDGTTLNGYYYFDENGKIVTEPGIHHLEMTCYTQNFDGSYYFGGANGALLQESTMTDDGFIVDDTGKVLNLEDLGIGNLKPQLENMVSAYQGTWSVYVKDLNEDKEITVNDQSLYSASLIKAFVMAKTYQDFETVKQNEAKKLNTADMKKVETKLNDLLWNMITVSDNESFNELVKLQTDALDFKKGAEDINKYLEKEGYKETSVQHTLHPAASAQETLGGRNMTSVKDCGALLEKIYNKECVSPEASEEMLNLLKNQENTWKIPEGLPEGILSANKTGETDQDQHDIAIVYGEKTAYIICVMSENCPEGTAVTNIQKISGLVYNYLNL